MRFVTMSVRDAQPGEIGAAASLWLRAEAARTGRPAPSDADVAGFAAGLGVAVAKPGALLLVGLAGDRIVATVYGVTLKADAAKAQVGMLAVEPTMWGKGIGAGMLAALTAALRERGCTALRMNVDPSNGRARALYERHGWRHSGETETVAGATIPELVYRLDLG